MKPRSQDIPAPPAGRGGEIAFQQWCSTVTAANYLAEAHSAGEPMSPFHARICDSIRDQARGWNDLTSRLLDRRDWLVGRPAICISAGFNQIGSFIARWRPATGFGSDRPNDEPHFRVEFVRECLEGNRTSGNMRPADEVLWIPDLRAICPPSPRRVSKLERLLLFAACSAYEEMVAALRAHIEVTSYTRIELGQEDTGKVTCNLSDGV